MYFHGGGWAGGDLDSHDPVCRILADVTGCLVVAVDYRLAPRHPFPAAPDDAMAAYRWVCEHAGELSIQPGRVAVMGDSSGGNLAAVVAQQARKTDVANPAAQILIYPCLDAQLRRPSHPTFDHGFFLTGPRIRRYRDQYLPDAAERTSPRASPIDEDDLDGLPPALVITAGFDPLRDEGRAYADALASAGVPVEYRCYDDLVHGFFSMGILADGAAIAAEICARVGELLQVGADGRSPDGARRGERGARRPRSFVRRLP